MALPNKWVEIERTDEAIFYGNTQDEYGAGTAWIGMNMKSGRSVMLKIRASCYGKERFFVDYHSMEYFKRDFQGSVLKKYNYAYNNRPITHVYHDTVGESIFNFACHIK